MEERAKRAGGGILVVDDDATVLLLATDILSAGGYEVATAGDGEGALRSFQSDRPALVLLDVQLPDLDGFEVCRRLRATPEGAATPVMMLTGLDDARSIEAAFDAGANDFFTKPINWLLLRSRVAFILRATASNEALRRSEERYALAAQGANDGLWDWDLQTGHVFYSARWRDMLGLRPVDVPAVPEAWLARVHAADVPRLRSALDAHLEGESEHFQCEHRILHADGGYRWVLNRGLARFVEGRAVRLAGSQTDVTERRLAQERLAHDALHDALTGLPNRTLFLDRLQNALELARRGDRGGLALLFIDLDHFKLVNDSQGHLAGDRLLVEMGHRLRAAVRTGDTVARIGGDEFTVLCSDSADVSVVAAIIERILQAARIPAVVEGRNVTVSASIGVALSGTGYARAEEMLRDADIAMYRAKALGRGGYEVFDDAMRQHVLERVAIEGDLREALGRGQIEVHYQPIVRLADGAVTGVEALARWRHPVRGLLEPDLFLPTAEESRLIVPVGREVLELACLQLARWRREGAVGEDWSVSVNASPTELDDPGFLTAVEEVLARASLPPGALRIELTETTLIAKPEAAARVLDALNERGVRLAIDDFGTGYSSLSTLHRFPFHVLKIDKSFVMGMKEADKRWEILWAIVTLGDNLGLEVVAEGVDTQIASEGLLLLGCRYGQGFSLGRPVPAGELSLTRAAGRS